MISLLDQLAITAFRDRSTGSKSRGVNFCLFSEVFGYSVVDRFTVIEAVVGWTLINFGLLLSRRS